MQGRHTPAGPTGVLTVSQLTDRLKRHIETRFGHVTVRGEVLSARLAGRGHLYLSLRDNGASIPCVIWRSTLDRIRLQVQDGMSISATGEIQVYAPHGKYQLIIRGVREDGTGALLQQLEQLKQRLAAEGLFDPSLKRALPRLPRRVGVVTAAPSAALEDIVATIAMRFPCAVLIWPARVQGVGAPESIAKGIHVLGQRHDLDVLIVGRGGGSMQDLWAFNDERVLRAISACPIPVISGVGHEIDHPLSDLVADVRAKTPTAAAERVVPERAQLRHALTLSSAAAQRALSEGLKHHRQHIAWLRARLPDPRRHIAEQQQRLDALTMRLRDSMREALRGRRRRQHALSTSLRSRHPASRLQQARAQVGAYVFELTRQWDALAARYRKVLGEHRGTLRALSPLGSLERGYAIARNPSTGHVFRDAKQLKEGAKIQILLHRGAVIATVDDTVTKHGFEAEES